MESKLDYEGAVLDARSSVNIAIVRPGLIWAEGGSAWTRIRAPLVQGMLAKMDATMEIAVDPENQYYCFTHIGDVAAAIELAALKLPIVNGSGVHPVFDLLGDRAHMGTLCIKDAEHFGCKGSVKLRKPDGVGYLDRIGGEHDVDSSNAETVLGWQPKKRHFLKDVHIYAKSFLAALALAQQK